MELATELAMQAASRPQTGSPYSIGPTARLVRLLAGAEGQAVAAPGMLARKFQSRRKECSAALGKTISKVDPMVGVDVT